MSRRPNFIQGGRDPDTRSVVGRRWKVEYRIWNREDVWPKGTKNTVYYLDMAKVKIELTPEVSERSFWSLSTTEVLKTLDSRTEGLDEMEAKRRQKLFGCNCLTKTQRLARTAIVLNQFKSPLILVLLMAGGLTLFLREWVDAGVIFAALLVNALMGFWQENKAETVLAHLRSYIHTRVRVRRENAEHTIDAEELVPGDVLRLSLGDRVPADARVLTTNNCLVDESILTGESLPVPKKETAVAVSAPLVNRTSMLYSGTLMVEGYCTAVVTSIGEHTEFGRIATLTARRERERTPLQKTVTRFAAWIGIVIAVFVAILFSAGLFSGYNVKDMFVLAVAVAVSSVPEGLPVALTVILAVGVERLARRKGIVRKLLAVETLGSTDVILTDKTGTLTQGKMSLAAVLPHGREEQNDFLADVVLSTDVVIDNPQADPKKWRISGRLMEVSLVQEAGGRGVFLPKLLKTNKIIEHVPFSSAQKCALTTVERRGEKNTLVLGAPEVVLGFCALSKDKQHEILKQVNHRAKTGERLLALASRCGPVGDKTNFTFRGLVAFRDPLRPSIKAVVERTRTLGIKTVIVTGDHQGTAEAVAREAGILLPGEKVITGSEMAKLRPDELEKILDQISVFARVLPEQKVEILNLYKKRGHIVAVTGDGVNDGPALKAADIGVAVGSGTEVAKGASDLIILDDNFETLVAAVEEGRRILGNIQKTIVYLLSNAADELFLIGGSLLAGLALPINALQILFVNFFSDSFPAIAFAFESGVDDAAERTGRQPSIFNKKIKILILGVGVGTSAILFILYAWLLGRGYQPEIVRTFIFASFSLYSLFAAFALRSLEVSIFRYNIFANKFLTGGVLVGVALTAAAIYLPFMQTILKTTALPLNWVGGIFVLAIVNILLVEIVKWIFRARAKIV